MARTWKAAVAVSVMLALGACSSSKKQEADEIPDAIPPADAATDAVPLPPSDGPPLPPMDAGAPPPMPAADPVAPPISSSSGSSDMTDTYTVQQGDTLMKIAFETYGDLYRWKEIYEANRDKISNPNAVPRGTRLKIDRPATPAAIDRNGEKYLIKRGDTLGSISGEVYGTIKKWRKLWENNRQLIRDPNKIFAGFYLYYLPETGTQPAPLAGTTPDSQRAPASTPAPAPTQ